MRRMMVALALGLLFVTPAFATGISDNFESYALGSFPSPTWQDVGTVMAPGQTLPSATVVSTTDAHGNPTQALAVADYIAPSRGIYATVPVSGTYSLAADIRVDQYSLYPDNTASDWAMQLTFAEAGVSNFAFTPQAGIYASSLTGDWRLFLIGGPGADIPLGVPAVVGTWYHVELDFNANTDTFHSIIEDAATGTVLVNQFNTISGLTPAETEYDSIAFFGGETSTNPGRPDLAVVDNVNISAVGTVPEPSGLVLLGSGLAAFVGAIRRKLNR